MNKKWLDEKIHLDVEILKTTLSNYFDKVNTVDTNNSNILSKNEIKYFIQLFISKLLDCKKCCKKCNSKVVSYRDIFHILFNIYSQVDENNDGTTECYNITTFIYEYNTKKPVITSRNISK